MHPSHHRRLERVRQAHERANTFEAVAREWISQNAGHWAAQTLQQRRHAVARDVFPAVGCLRVRQVTPAHVLSIVKRVEKPASAMAVLVNQAIGGVFRMLEARWREFDLVAALWRIPGERMKMRDRGPRRFTSWASPLTSGATSKAITWWGGDREVSTSAQPLSSH